MLPTFGALCTAWEDGPHGSLGSARLLATGPLVTDGGMGASLIGGGAPAEASFEALSRAGVALARAAGADVMPRFGRYDLAAEVVEAARRVADSSPAPRRSDS